MFWQNIVWKNNDTSIDFSQRNKLFTCSNNLFFGTFGVFDHLSKTIYDGIPKNYISIELYFDLLLLGIWNNEGIQVNSSSSSSNFTQSFVLNDNFSCFNGNIILPDNPRIIHVNLSINIPSITNFTINFTTYGTTSSSNCSFGLKNFKVLIHDDCPKTCKSCDSNGYCLKCPNFAGLNAGVCQCISHFYRVFTDYVHCDECHISCQNCQGPSEFECLSCYAGDTLVNGKCMPPLSFFLRFYQLNKLFFLRQIFLSC